MEDRTRSYLGSPGHTGTCSRCPGGEWRDTHRDDSRAGSRATSSGSLLGHPGRYARPEPRQQAVHYFSILALSVCMFPFRVRVGIGRAFFTSSVYQTYLKN